MVPPQFTPITGASWDPNRSAGCTGPYPSFPTEANARSGKPLRKVFHTKLLTALHQPAALWRNGTVCTGFLQRVIGMYCLVYHFHYFKSIAKNPKNAQILHPISVRFVSAAKTDVCPRKILSGYCRFLTVCYNTKTRRR